MTTRRVFFTFLRLGCTSFGGPVAHLGYFRSEFVTRQKWISDRDYADLVALCQFLPGPASSQVGIALGYGQTRWRGAFAAWLGFTLPSAVLMIGFALGIRALGWTSSAGWIQGLGLAAMAVVAQATLQMGRVLCSTIPTLAIAVGAAVLVIAIPASWIVPVAIALGVIVGGFFVKKLPTPAVERHRAPSHRAGRMCLILFVGLGVLLPIVAALSSVPAIQHVDAFYRSGMLVFGGGHVVLPLLNQATVARRWIPESLFLAGYGAAQALPGPLFAFSAFLGTSMTPGGVLGGLLALVSLYLPGVLILFAALPFWESLRGKPKAQAWLAGANASVVGLLAASLAGPMGRISFVDVWHLSVFCIAFCLLWFVKLPAWAVAGLAALAASVLFAA